jgi:hypothetical protein
MEERPETVPREGRDCDTKRAAANPQCGRL